MNHQRREGENLSRAARSNLIWTAVGTLARHILGLVEKI
jgi:hypothetical protein